MNNYFKALAITLVTALLIFAAGGCGGGGSDSGGGPGGTPSETFTKAVLSTVEAPWGNIINTDSFRHYQMLYKKADIAGSGSIRSLYFRYNGNVVTATTCSNFTIKLGHTSVENLNTNMTLNINQGKGSAVTVLNGATITIPAGTAGDYFEIPLTTHFNYNGIDNLVIDITRSAASSQAVNLGGGVGTTDYTGAAYTNQIASPDTATYTSEYPLHVKLLFAGGDNKVICADKTANSQMGIAPGYTGRVQMLILASDIKGNGLITSMALNPDVETADADVTGMTVKIAHIPAGTTTLASNIFADNYSGVTPVTVTQGLSYQVPEGQPSNVWIPFNTNSFNYDGTSNLLIDISCTVASGNYSVDYESLPAGITRVLYSTVSPAATTGTLRDRAFEPVFRFYGGTVNVVAPDASGVGIFYPFHNTDDNMLQYLYSAAELGIKGSISKISLRLFSDNSAASGYSNFTVILGQSDDIILGDTVFSANLTGAQTVYNGSFTVSGGLVKGDWIDIPLSVPFACDSTKNLVVQFSGSHGTAINSIVRELDDTRYLNRQAHADNTSGTIDGRYNCLADIKLEVK